MIADRYLPAWQDVVSFDGDTFIPTLSIRYPLSGGQVVHAPLGTACRGR
ncbi:MAG: hypothetical protein JWM87_769 [Candidatus Eremiobacteraeota bacterium]|nr:hypothetical protein [Candidatus Eremiobacteraeota bacterium]